MRGALPLALLLRIAPSAASAASASSAEAVPRSDRGSIARFPGDDDDASSVARIADDVRSPRISARECWTSSVAAVYRWTIDGGGDGDDAAVDAPLDGARREPPSSGGSYCASMTGEEVEVVALEATRCQLAREGRPFFEARGAAAGRYQRRPDARQIEVAEGSDDEDFQNAFESACPAGRGGSIRYRPSSCLPLMSEYALTLHHQVLLHVQDVCARLTEERLVLRKEEAIEGLVRASSLVSQEIRSATEGATALVERMQVQSALVAEQSAAIAAQREELERAALARRIEEEAAQALLREQASLLEAQSTTLAEQREESDRTHRERERAADAAMHRMANRTASFWRQYEEQGREKRRRLEADLRAREEEAAASVERAAREAAAKIAEQAGRIEGQRRDLERMEEMIANTTSHMQPLSRIEAYAKLFTESYAYVKAAANFFLSAFAAWSMTTLPFLRRSRRRLFGTLGLGFLLEVALVRYADHPLLADVDGTYAIEAVRHLTRACAAAILLLAPCLSPPTKEHDPCSIPKEDVLRTYIETAVRVRAEAAAETKRAEAIRASVGSASGELVEASGGILERPKVQTLYVTPKKVARQRGRSRPSRQSYPAGTIVPVVTPATSSTSTQVAYPPAGYVRSAHILAREEDRGYRPELEHVRTHYARCSEALEREERESWSQLERTASRLSSTLKPCNSSDSSDESTESTTSSARRKRKRRASDVYSSTRDEEMDCSDGNDDDESISSGSYSSTGIRENKKCKLNEEGAE